MTMSPAGSKNAPEAKAREKIDALLTDAGWLLQGKAIVKIVREEFAKART